jgi:hypothetical protein
MSCEPPFWKDLSVLTDLRLQYQPSCEHSSGNFIMRVLLLSLFVGLIGSVVGGLSFIMVALLFGGITATVIVMTTSHAPKEVKKDTHVSTPSSAYHKMPYQAVVDPSGYQAPIKEHFINGGSKAGSVQPLGAPVGSPIGNVEVDAAPYSGPSLPDYTPPTSRNLFMNVLLDEMKYNPDRPEAAPVGHPTVKQTLDDFFRIQWFSDPTDVFGKNQGQRQFVTQPSTTVPNDQGSFANWLYKIPGKTCKEGGRAACTSGTDGGQLVWMNQE